MYYRKRQDGNTNANRMKVFNRKKFYSREEKLKLIKEFYSIGAPVGMFCNWYGVNIHTFKHWQKVLARYGEEALENRRGGRTAKEIPDAVKNEIIRIKVENPGLLMAWRTKISESSVWRIRQKFRKKRLKKKEKKECCVHWQKLHTCWYVDTLRIRVREGLVYFQAVIEELSRCIIGYAIMPRLNTGNTAQLLRKTMDEMGTTPVVFKYDRGSEFTNHEVTELLTGKGVYIMPSPPNYPPFNGKFERLVKDIRKALKIFMTKKTLTYAGLMGIIQPAVRYLNCDKPRRMFGGKTC